MLLIAQGLVQNDQRLVVTVRTLNVDQIIFNGQPVDIGWHKAREVLYYLLAHPDGETIDVLREAIWTDLKPQRSRDALRSAIYQLRDALPREFIELHGRQNLPPEPQRRPAQLRCRAILAYPRYAVRRS